MKKKIYQFKIENELLLVDNNWLVKNKFQILDPTESIKQVRIIHMNHNLLPVFIFCITIVEPKQLLPYVKVNQNKEIKKNIIEIRLDFKILKQMAKVFGITIDDGYKVLTYDVVFRKILIFKVIHKFRFVHIGELGKFVNLLMNCQKSDKLV